MSVSVDTIREILESSRHELNHLGTWPVDLLPILERSGVSCGFVTARDRCGTAYLRLGEIPEILLVRSEPGGAGLTRRERFSVAHELAHFFLWQHSRVPPAATRSQYWQHEALCNEFAGRLLVPPDRLRSIIRAAKPSVPAVCYPHLIAKAADVTWAVAARAISSETRGQLCYLRLSQEQDKPDLFTVDCSSLESRSHGFIGQSALLRGTELNKDLIMVQQAAERGHGSSYSLPVTLKVGSLRLKDAPCAVMYQDRRWVLQFTAASMAEAMDRQAADVAASNRKVSSAWRGQDRYTRDATPEQAVPASASSGSWVTPVQRMTIKSLMSRQGIDGFNEMELLARRFLKVKAEHLTRQEAASLLKELQEGLALAGNEALYPAPWFLPEV